ncbi:MAG: alpha-hydroxy-acid oxidizing protein [Verrucomicrobia bacterium]|nr:alpha-hydroxy-acid oxidizing protein [Verrucomicrobiota bacterium]
MSRFGLAALLFPAASLIAASATPPARKARRPRPDLASFISVTDFELAFESRTNEMSRAFVKGGAADEITIRWNREAFDRIVLKPRVLVDVSQVDTRVKLPGLELPHPIILAPTAFHRMVNPLGEPETARGAASTKSLFVVSSSCNTRISEIAQAAPGSPLWFQMYVQSDREFVKDVVREVEAAGVRALMLTVDAPVVGPRYRQIRAKFKLTPGLKLPYMLDVNKGRDSLLRGGNMRMTWADIEWLKSITRLPVWLKGILDPDDAERAVRHGAAGIVVSNHGGRGLDTAPATITALTSIASKVAGRIPILMDGGVRRGTDVLKALALGAKAVMIGRPYLHGLAVAGAPGLGRVVEILRDEFEQALALTGRTSIDALDRSVIWETQQK